MEPTFKAAVIITVSRSDRPDHEPAEILAFHRGQRAWWSSTKHRGIWRGMPAFVRFAGTNEVISRATFIGDQPAWETEPPEPDLVWRYEVEFAAREPVRSVFLRDLGIVGARARPGLIGLNGPERNQIDAALPRDP